MAKKNMPAVVNTVLEPDEILPRNVPAMPHSTTGNVVTAGLQSITAIANAADKEEERKTKLVTKVNETGDSVIDSAASQQAHLDKEYSANAAMYRKMAEDAETQEDREKYMGLATAETDKMKKSQDTTRKERDHIYHDQAASRDDAKKGLGTGAKIAIEAVVVGGVTALVAVANPDATKTFVKKAVDTLADTFKK